MNASKLPALQAIDLPDPAAAIEVTRTNGGGAAAIAPTPTKTPEPAKPPAETKRSEDNESSSSSSEPKTSAGRTVRAPKLRKKRKKVVSVSMDVDLWDRLGSTVSRLQADSEFKTDRSEILDVLIEEALPSDAALITMVRANRGKWEK